MTSPVGLKREHTSDSPGGLVKRQIAGPHPRVGICISSKFPDAVEVARWGTTHLDPHLNYSFYRQETGAPRKEGFAKDHTL